MTTPTLKEQIAEVGREIGMRRGAYPNFVARGRYTQEEADKRLLHMEAVYRTLKWLEANREAVVNNAISLPEGA